MPVFDTSALLPLFNPDHPYHKKAKRAFESNEQVILHPLVIYGFTTVVRRLAKDHGADGIEEARKGLLALLDEPRVEVRAEMDYTTALDLYLAVPHLSFTDAVVAESRHQLDKSAPVAFDDRLAQAQALSKAERLRLRQRLGSRLSGT